MRTKWSPPSALFLACALAVSLILPAAARAEVQTFFTGTQYATRVHFLHGKEPGPTILVQGGIQGDEYCGYLTAQLLTQAKVKRGTLIIVPRANPPSVHNRKREVNVDMNRRFDRDYGEFYEDSLARLVRHLTDQSQGVIHLHEGSGFYNPVRLDDLHGPQRYGQSIVIDADTCGEFPLGRVARKVIATLNDGLKPEKYRFKLFNQDTFNDRSQYLEQRRSLTYYAMSRRHIPALDVEVSKNLVGPHWSHWKVTQQMRATVLFLRAFGLELEAPEVRLADFLDYPPQGMALKLNDQALAPAASSARLATGEPIVAAVVAKGRLSPLAPILCAKASDRIGLNLLEGRRLPLAPFERVTFTADGIPLGTAKITWGQKQPSLNGSPQVRPGDLLCWLNGELKAVAPGQTLTVLEGDQLILEGIAGSRREEVLNLKGFVSHPGRDDGQDAGVEIVLDPAMFQQRFIKHGASGETLCEIVRETPGVNPRPRFLLKLLPRRVEALVLLTPSGQTVTLPWAPGKPLTLAPGKYVLKDIHGNGPAAWVQAFVNEKPIGLGAELVMPTSSTSTKLVLRQTTTFRELGAMPLVPAGSDSGQAAHGNIPVPAERSKPASKT